MRLISSFALTLTLALTASAQDAPNADVGADAGTDADAPPPLPPKIAVVVAGDPDESLRAAASEIEQECTSAGLRTLVDPALRAAMRGEPGTEEDGLEGLRSIRRSLGVNPRKDFASYKRIGTIAGADVLVVLRREGTIDLEVFDVSASQFYEGMLEVDKTTPEERVKYIERRAKIAQERWNQDASVAAAGGHEAAGKPADEPEKKRWIKKAWPYFVVGALLAAGVTYLIVDQRRTNDPGPSLLRFRPGDE